MLYHKVMKDKALQGKSLKEAQMLTNQLWGTSRTQIKTIETFKEKVSTFILQVDSLTLAVKTPKEKLAHNRYNNSKTLSTVATHSVVGTHKLSLCNHCSANLFQTPIFNSNSFIPT